MLDLVINNSPKLKWNKINFNEFNDSFIDYNEYDIRTKFNFKKFDIKNLTKYFIDKFIKEFNWSVVSITPDSIDKLKRKPYNLSDEEFDGFVNFVNKDGPWEYKDIYICTSLKIIRF